MSTTASRVLLVSPVNFRYNRETGSTNAFQEAPPPSEALSLADLALFPKAKSAKANAKGEKKILPDVRLLPWRDLHQNLNIATVALCLFGIQKPSIPGSR